MTIQHLAITHCRNIESIAFTPGQRMNLFIGDNGSGKTSILEAVYLLGLGRSFRTTLLDRVIQHSAAAHMTVAKVGSLVYPAEWVAVGMQRQRGGTAEYKIAGEYAKTRAELAAVLPLQLINAASYRLLQEGPEQRRALLNVGVFHVEQNFFPLWQRFNRLLRQRNAALRDHCADSEIRIWDNELINVSEQIDNLRECFFNQWVVLACEMLNGLLPHHNIAFHYDGGWDKKQRLGDVFTQAFERDKLRKYTTEGIQRANFTVLIDNVPAQHALSLGQQKSLVTVLQLAQGLLIRTLADRQSIYLIDDLPAELDKRTREWLLDLLQAASVQVFLTGVDEATLPGQLCGANVKTFHVEHGKLRE